MEHFDAIIVGAGAAGLFCAARAGQQGLRVLLLDHSDRIAEKIRISGGGRCNFTNRDAGPANYLSDNPRFARSALSRYTPADFIALVQRHRIAFHEKHKGQLFCDHSAEDIIAMLLRENEAGGVVRRQPCGVRGIRRSEGETPRFELDTDAGPVAAPRLVIATGGLPVPAIGATDFGLKVAQQFGLGVIAPRPALVPLTFDAQAWAPFAALSGIALPAGISCGAGKARTTFLEDLLFTHRGLSGPGILQISSFWRPGQPIEIDLTPGLDLAARLLEAKQGSRRQLGNEFATLLPARLAEAWLAGAGLDAARAMPECRDRDLQALAQRARAWSLQPAGDAGWKKAEVMAGGVDTRELSSQSLESRKVPGLHFIGEVVDVTGWLGGYNFQWAWASAAACADAMAAGRA